jgi:subtilase family serine protease
VTSVGGTTLADRAGAYQFEAGWGLLGAKLSDDRTAWSPAPPGSYPSGYLAGGGGGVSSTVQQPYYQRGIVPNALATALPDGTTASTPMRVVPDVAADGDNNTGILVGQTQRLKDGKDQYLETRWGGTSLSCPIFVAIQARAQQAQHGVALGFANPALYARYGTAAFHDVTDQPLGQGVSFGVARNDYTDRQDPTSKVLTTYQTFGHNGPLHATAGYDDVTGVGSPAPGYVGSYRR